MAAIIKFFYLVFEYADNISAITFCALRNRLAITYNQNMLYSVVSALLKALFSVSGYVYMVKWPIF